MNSPREILSVFAPLIERFSWQVVLGWALLLGGILLGLRLVRRTETGRAALTWFGAIFQAPFALLLGRHLRAAELFSTLGRHHRAAVLYQKAGTPALAADEFARVGEHLRAAEFYERIGDHSTAADLYERAGSHLQAARCHESTGRRGAAAKAFEAAGELTKAAELYSQMEQHGVAAEIFVRAGELQKAARSFEKGAFGEVSELSPEGRQHQDLLRRAAELYLEIGEPSRAAGLLEKLGDFDRAAQRYEEAGNLKGAARCLLAEHRVSAAADMLERGGDIKGAIGLRVEALKRDGDYAGAARILAESGGVAEAAELYLLGGLFVVAAEYFAIAGDHASSARAFLEGGKPEQAALAFEAAGQLESAAAVFAELNDQEERLRVLNELGSPLLLGQYFVENGRDEEAIVKLQDVPDEAPDYRECMQILGQIMLRKREWKLARTRLEAGLEHLSPTKDNLHLFFGLAESLQNTGGREKAITVLEEIINVDYLHTEAKGLLDRLTLEGAQTEESAGESTLSLDVTPEELRTEPSRYRVLNEVGRGGMGVVYQAEDTLLGRRVAYKVLARQVGKERSTAKLILREARSVARLSHPNIVTVHDAGVDEERLFIVMELIKGETLEQILRREGPFDVRRFLRIVLPVCDGLEYVHTHGLVHRDIKPSNIMIGKNDKVKIMDFGLATVEEETISTQSHVVGTPKYMSPEQIMGRGVDSRSDIYSLGATMYEMLCGTALFPRGMPVFHHLYTPSPELKSPQGKLPAYLSEAIMRCVEKTPDHRFRSAVELREALSRQ